MHRDLVTLDVLQNARVGGGLTAGVMFRLQPVDGDADLQAPQRRPREWNGPHRAGHDLDEEAAIGELRQNDIELAIPHQRFPANQRNMQWAQPIDELEDAVNERRTLAIAESAQRLGAAQMLVAIGVAARAAERAFACDFNREIGTPAREYLPPGADDAFHQSTLALGRPEGKRQK